MYSNGGGEGKAGVLYHEAQLAPLVEEVAVHVDAVGLGQVLGDELPDGREVGFFLRGVVLYVSEILGRRRGVWHFFSCCMLLLEVWASLAHGDFGRSKLRFCVSLQHR